MYQFISEQSIYQYFGDDDPEMLKTMIQIILETNIHDLKELSAHYDAGDFDTIKKQVHKAKPSMSYIGAQSSRKLLEEIEGNLQNSHSSFVKLQANLAKIEEELQTFLEKI